VSRIVQLALGVAIVAAGIYLARGPVPEAR